MRVKSNVRRSVSTRHVAGSSSRSVNRFGRAGSRAGWRVPGSETKKAASSRLAAFFMTDTGGLHLKNPFADMTLR
jgi:hypothetical protein